MSEEIKEIAESLREISTPTGLSYSGDRTLNNSYTEKIIDYITSLQQKVEQLEKENDDLKNRLDNEVADGNLRLKEFEQLESIRKEAIEYMKEFIFEPLLISEDRKLIMFNENLKNFENILSKGDNNVKD